MLNPSARDTRLHGATRSVQVLNLPFRVQGKVGLAGRAARRARDELPQRAVSGYRHRDLRPSPRGQAGQWPSQPGSPRPTTVPVPAFLHTERSTLLCRLFGPALRTLSEVPAGRGEPAFSRLEPTPPGCSGAQAHWQREAVNLRSLCSNANDC